MGLTQTPLRSKFTTMVEKEEEKQKGKGSLSIPHTLTPIDK